MAVRIGRWLTIAAVLVLMMLTRPGPFRVLSTVRSGPELSRPVAVQPPPPMFSPWYADSLQNVLELEPADAEALEHRLARNPRDARLRLRVMAYHCRADRAVHREDARKRLEHVVWLVRNDPGSEILHSYVSRFSKDQLTEPERNRLSELWEAASRARPKEARIQWNAACYFEGWDTRRHMLYLEKTAAADPNHPFALRPLAYQYASAIRDGGALSDHSRSALETSKNVWIVGNAAHILQSFYNASVQMETPNARLAELAERYFLRAKVLDPTLQRSVILPQLGAQAASRQPAPAEDALPEIRRLTLDAYPELPPQVAALLRRRNCTVPQPSSDEGSPKNVIRGEFIAKGEPGWAALCSVNHSTSLLVFRNDDDSAPLTVNVSDDRGSPRAIAAVGRDFILRHYRAYGGQEPPAIDHHGIDDAFPEKGSMTWYFDRGKWLRLTGSD